MRPMTLSCPIEKLTGQHELVICDSAISKKAHQALFHFKEDCYLAADDETGVFWAVAKIVETLNRGDSGTSASIALHGPAGTCGKIHVAMLWENILRLALWQEKKPGTGEVFTLLGNLGLSPRELQPFRKADINDLFPWLFYGKRFDVLRKICREVKRRMEESLKGNSHRVVCHIVAADIAGIVASSL
jgi:hypothetical protein